jgi:hypothetical protein
MSHLISVEIDEETARQFIEWAHHNTGITPPDGLLLELYEAMQRALEEDDADV